MITRRDVIQGVASLVVAPAVIRVATLMPIKVMPPEPVLQGMTRNVRNFSVIWENIMPGLSTLADEQYYVINGKVQW